ncbi:MAG: dihydrolipoyl dehydrogenase [Woeseiaceae bacterium]|nr:dihydrolipoyl dehydrogenase [Woeseiaceae bacterium]
MQERHVDVAVIGAGSAGLGAYRSALEWTPNVVMIEGGPYGTTCARVGCMPSKLLIAAAEAAHASEQASEFGVNTGSVAVDGVAVMDRVRRERDRFVGFVVESVDNIPAEHKLVGNAVFINDNTLMVGDHTRVSAKRIVIATGSSPAWPRHLEAAEDRLIVNDDVFDWQDLPESVAVFGPGVIGLELGQALHRLGVRVHMFGIQSIVGPLTDPAIRSYAEKTFSEEFFLDADANVTSIERSDKGVSIGYLDDEGNEQTISVDYLVAATGRRPNVFGLSLENTSLLLDERGVPVVNERTMQIGDTHVFLAGDATNTKPLLHEASDEGRIAGRNAGRYPNVEEGFRRSPLGVVFSDPQIAMVGSTYKELEHRNIVVGSVSFEDQGRSRVMLKNKGLLHVYAEATTGRFLGAEMIGPSAEHIGHLLAWAHQQGLTINDMLSMPFYHPVVEEGLRTALRNACAQLADCGLRAA